MANKFVCSAFALALAAASAALLLRGNGNGEDAGLVRSSTSGSRNLMSTKGNNAESSTYDELLQERPPLSDLIGDSEADVKGDVQFLLDFAMIGHAKTATSIQMTWIRTHSEIQMYNREIRSLHHGRPAEFVSLMYALPEGNQYKRGYKAPNDIRTQNAMDALRTYFPETRLIVGIRHPIHWFESWYNYNARIGHGKKTADSVTNGDYPDHGLFHVHLARMGKTNVLDATESKLLRWSEDAPPKMTNPVFLYEVTQPFDKDETRISAYRKDLSDFLGLTTTLDPLVPGSSTSRNYHFAMDICEHQYRSLRNSLVEMGGAAAEWILNYFATLPEVTVSSPDHFRYLLSTWNKDPCSDN